MIQDAFSHFFTRRRNTKRCVVTLSYIIPSRNIRLITTENVFRIKNQKTNIPKAPITIKIRIPRLSEPVIEPIAAAAVTMIDPELT